MRFGTVARALPAPEVLEDVRRWTRQRFKLPDEAVVLVAQVACRTPGCAPLETAVAFWRDEKRHQFKLYKPAAEIAYDDIGWLFGSHSDGEGFECC